MFHVIGRFVLIMLASLGIGVLIRMFLGPPPTEVRTLARNSHDEDSMTPGKPSQSARVRASVSEKSFQILRWDTLKGLNLKNNEVSEDLKAVVGSAVRIPGYVVPLAMDDAYVDEFLLVPTMGACIHTPPPAANQMILVRIYQQRSPKREDGPVWVHGKLELARTNTEWGGVAFAFNAVSYSSYEGGYD